ncbi:MAG: hypothetical protein IPK13_13670 [Deltaproteobacteria bacterium]|nr:hypothetical protein [Deltaproteobacteria bacterium]
MANDINIGKGQQAASANVWMSPNDDTLNIGMSISDSRLRSLGIETDGLERPFVIVPRHGEWKRYDLQYGGTYSNRGSNEIRDSYNLCLNLEREGLSLDEVKAEGLAFGLNVSGSYGSDPATLWLQGYGDNYRP